MSTCLYCIMKYSYMKYGDVRGSMSRGRLTIIAGYMALYNQDGRRAGDTWCAMVG